MNDDRVRPRPLPLSAACTLFLAVPLLAGCGLLRSSSAPAPQTGAARAAQGENRAAGAPRPFRDVIPESLAADSGLFTVYHKGDSVFFQIPDTLLNREMLLISRIARVPPEFGGFQPAGVEAETQVVTWERQGDRVLLRKQSYAQVAADTTAIAVSVVANNLPPIIASFPVRAIGPDSASVVIDVTEFYRGDTPAIGGLTAEQRQEYGVRRLDPARSFINYARAYPENIEVRHTQTFEATEPPSNVRTGSLSLEMNQSMVLLPEEPMRPRYADPRVGFSSIERVNFGLTEQKAATQTFIRRWRLEPRDAAAYARGEVVEPVKPIVYYLDPATPPEYRSCVRDGVEDWQPAFETAGFRNAIVARDAPSAEQDPEWHPEDVRYSVVRWAASLTRNAQGPSTSDPRTGEIIESDIVWYHNHLRSYRNRIMVETGAANPLARSLPIDQGLMCEAMRQVIAHEIGHALGLPHNMISSSAYPVDSLRSKSFAERMGVAPSVMDYARQNYIAQPGDGLEGDDFLRQIGPYDHYAINWGYRVLPEAATPEAERPILNKWIVDKADDPMYRFLPQGAAADPRAQTEDIGADAVKAGTYAIANLKRVVPNLVAWTSAPGEDYTELEEIYGELLGSWQRYIGHVAANIGGVYADLKSADQQGGVFRAVPRAQQERALAFLAEHVFEAPTWLLEEDILARVDANGFADLTRRQANVLSSLLSAQRLARMAELEVTGGDDVYPLAAYFDDVREAVWRTPSMTARDAYRRALQREHVERLAALVNPPPPPTGGGQAGQGGQGGPGGAAAAANAAVQAMDVAALARAQLVAIRQQANAAAGGLTTVSQAHLLDIVQRIDRALSVER